ncbi:MAG: hypothetical protein HS108_11410 [Planctomycetes bacterium]|nr:hypothetical protein [Planctomycetota bacterium]MCL4729420.1 hypothetical protein [Planctomycetota bacterium]
MTRLLCVLVLSCLLVPGAGDAQRKKDDKAKDPDGPVAQDLDAKELQAARRHVAGMKEHERAMYDALRYLLKPAFQDELFRGRARHACPLPALDADTKAELSVDEKLRLHGMLSVGVAYAPAWQPTVDRLLGSPLPQPQPRPRTSLGLCGLEMLIARDLSAAAPVMYRERLVQRAREVLRVSEQADFLAGDSPNQATAFTPARWFFNHFWRVAIARVALEMGLECNVAKVSGDLDALLAVWDKDRGFKGGGEERFSQYYDAEPNAIAFATLSLALAAPDKLLPRARRAVLQKHLEAAPAMLKKYNTQLESSADPVLALLRTALRDDLAPEGEKDPAQWRTQLVLKLIEAQRPNGSFPPRSNRAAAIGWVCPGVVEEGGAALDTAVLLNVLAGGPFPARRVLKGVKPDELNKAMRSLALVEAAAARVVSPVFRQRVITAITDGCAFLADTQRDDGSFPGYHAHLTGHHALVLLTLLHGGVDRDNAVIRKGLDWLEKQEHKVSSCTYDAAVMLMFYQKYHEPEIKAAGMLGAKNTKDWQAARKKLQAALPPTRAALFARMVSDLDAAFTKGEGGWGYTRVPQTAAEGYRGTGDSSNSQYAMLGYRSACLLGCDVKTSVFRHEAERLVKHFFVVDLANIAASYHRRGAPHSPDRSTPPKVPLPEEFKDLSPQPGGWGYGCLGGPPDFAMTAAGAGSLSICMDELRLRGELDDKLEREINRRVAGALMYIRHEYFTDDACRAVHAATGGSPLWDGCGFFYDLYSTERCCELLKVRELPGQLDWYRVGADLLCYTQNVDGSWRTDNLPERTETVPSADGKPATQRLIPQMANICMAVLFLKRAAVPVFTDHRKFDRSKPRDDDDPADAPPSRPITGEKKDKPAESRENKDGK